MRVLVATGLVVLWGCSASRPLAAAIPAATQAPAIAVDLHLHVTMSSGARPIFSGEPGNGTLTWNPKVTLVNQIDEGHLKAAGVKLALGCIWPPYSLRPGQSALAGALGQLAALEHFTQRQPGFAFTRTAAEARVAIARGRIALMPAVEGGEGIGEVDDVDRLWNAGMRAITLMHFENNRLGGAAKGQTTFNVFGIKNSSPEPLGLTPLGREAVERMMDLGIVLDLAHASDALSNDVLDLAEARGVPVVNSHSASRPMLQIERSIPDALAARIALGGGLIGAVINASMVRQVPKAEQWDGFVEQSCDEAVAHWLHLAKVTGPEALTLGSDFNGFILRHGVGGSCPNGIRNAADLPAFWAALEAHGVPHAALDGMGERFLALLEKVEAKARPEAQAAARLVRTAEPDLFAAP